MSKNEKDIDVSILECNSWPRLMAKVHDAGGYPVVLFTLDDSGNPTGAGRACTNHDQYKENIQDMLRGSPGLKYRIIAAQTTTQTSV